jgi:diguanylate cyclase (GGDEF)-like protein
MIERVRQGAEAMFRSMLESSSIPRTRAILLGIALIVACVGLDIATGPDVSVAIFYLLPVFVLTWFGSRRLGLAGVALSAAGLLISAGFDQGRWIPNRPSDYWNALVDAAFFVIVAISLAALRRALATERELARTDSLTGCANRRAFFERLDTELQHCIRDKAAVTLLFLDVDGFKRVNDRLGHHGGDLVLARIARELEGRLRASDLIGRLGGDEFAILLSGADFAGGESALDDLRSTLAAASHRQGWGLTFSIGAVTCEQGDFADSDALMRQADLLMYEVKRAGRDSFRHERAPTHRIARMPLSRASAVPSE